jgi:hypothetical protein
MDDQARKDALADAATYRQNYPERFVSMDYHADEIRRWWTYRRATTRKLAAMVRLHAVILTGMAFRACPGLRG